MSVRIGHTVPGTAGCLAARWPGRKSRVAPVTRPPKRKSPSAGFVNGKRARSPLSLNGASPRRPVTSACAATSSCRCRPRMGYVAPGGIGVRTHDASDKVDPARPRPRPVSAIRDKSNVVVRRAQSVARSSASRPASTGRFRAAASARGADPRRCRGKTSAASVRGEFERAGSLLVAGARLPLKFSNPGTPIFDAASSAAGRAALDRPLNRAFSATSDARGRVALHASRVSRTAFRSARARELCRTGRQACGRCASTAPRLSRSHASEAFQCRTRRFAARGARATQLDVHGREGSGRRPCDRRSREPELLARRGQPPRVFPHWLLRDAALQVREGAAARVPSPGAPSRPATHVGSSCGGCGRSSKPVHDAQRPVRLLDLHRAQEPAADSSARSTKSSWTNACPFHRLTSRRTNAPVVIVPRNVDRAGELGAPQRHAAQSEWDRERLLSNDQVHSFSSNWIGSLPRSSRYTT